MEERKSGSLEILINVERALEIIAVCKSDNLKGRERRNIRTAVFIYCSLLFFFQILICVEEYYVYDRYLCLVWKDQQVYFRLIGNKRYKLKTVMTPTKFPRRLRYVQTYSKDDARLIGWRKIGPEDYLLC